MSNGLFETIVVDLSLVEGLSVVVGTHSHPWDVTVKDWEGMRLITYLTDPRL